MSSDTEALVIAFGFYGLLFVGILLVYVIASALYAEMEGE